MRERRITVRASRTYEVLIEEGLLSRAGEKLRALGPPCRVALITDERVDALWAGAITESLKQAGFQAERLALPPGEASKSLEGYGRVLHFLASGQFTRGDLVLALGGGVVGDLAGFAAATYLRGVGLVQVPTTVLAAVDSSVGGKTAVNLKAGKNLAGTFYQPRLVLIDPLTFGTLPGEVFRDGMAEVIKYGMIGDLKLLEGLASGLLPGGLGGVAERCVAMKARIVAQDERDTEGRQILNFGHTVGHAAEALSGYSLSHGIAVAAGMAVITRGALRRGWCPPRCLHLLLAALDRQGLPADCAYSASDLARAARADKKRAGDQIVLALPDGPGSCTLRSLPLLELEALIADGKEGPP